MIKSFLVQKPAESCDGKDIEFNDVDVVKTPSNIQFHCSTGCESRDIHLFLTSGIIHSISPRNS